MSEIKDSFFDLHKMGLEYGFWEETYKSVILKQIELSYKPFVLKEYGISDLIIDKDKVLLKWYKRMEPLTENEITPPKIYIGTCVKSPAGNTNINMVWVECKDGLFRSNHSTIVMNYEQMQADETNNYVKRIL